MMTIGERLESLIESRFGKRGKKAAAERLGISAPYLSDVCSDRRGISAEMAVRISKVFGAGLGEDLYRQAGELELKAAREADRKAAGRKRT